jgi:hypothetical protein
VSNPAVDAAGAETERFTGPGGRLFGWAGVVFAAALVVYVVVLDPTHDIKGICVALCLAALSWVVLIRPMVSSNANGVILRNMLRDTFVPWSKIERCRVVQTLQIATDEAHFHGLGVGRSARKMVRRDYGRTSFMMRGGGLLLGGTGSRLLDRPPPKTDDRPAAERMREGIVYQDYVETRIGDQARQAKPDGLQPVVSWDWRPIAAVVVAIVSFAVLLVG